MLPPALAHQRCCAVLPKSGKAFGGARLISPVVQRRQQQQRQQQTVFASAIAEPATLEVKDLSGSSVGTESLALKVAGDSTARGLVHR